MSSDQEKNCIELKFPKGFFKKQLLVPEFTFDFLEGLKGDESARGLFKHLDERTIQLKNQKEDPNYYSEPTSDSDYESDENTINSPQK